MRKNKCNYSVTEWTDEEIDFPYAIWNEECNDYYADRNGIMPTFATTEEAQEYIDKNLSKEIKHRHIRH